MLVLRLRVNPPILRSIAVPFRLAGDAGSELDQRPFGQYHGVKADSGRRVSRRNDPYARVAEVVCVCDSAIRNGSLREVTKRQESERWNGVNGQVDLEVDIELPTVQLWGSLAPHRSLKPPHGPAPGSNLSHRLLKPTYEIAPNAGFLHG